MNRSIAVLTSSKQRTAKPEMAFSQQSPDQSFYTCYLCLEIFTEPVSTPCGHNFCRSCISQAWRGPGPYKCPVCKEEFNSQPQLKVNAFVSTMVTQYKSQRQKIPLPHLSKPAKKEVFCDFCTEPKNIALKYCRDCSSSFCSDHLQPHLTVIGLKRHQLTDPRNDLGNLKNMENMENQYKRPVPDPPHTSTNRKIQERVGKIQELRTVMHQSQNVANTKAKEVVEAFNSVVVEVQRSLDQFTDVIEETQRQMERQAQDMIQTLEKEISELQKRDSEDLIFLHGSSFRPALVLQEWDKVFIEPLAYDDTVSGVVLELEEKISDKLKSLVVNSDLKRVQQWAVNLMLDPKTAHPKLVLSFDEKEVSYSEAKRKVSDNADRFTQCCNVVTRQSFSSGRFYFEVLVKGKTNWDLGVAKKSVNRKKKIQLSPANGFWTIWLRDRDKISALESPPVLLPVKRAPEKVGVYVDYDLGLVSFYDANTGALLYSFSGCTFKDKLMPIFNPCLSESGHNAAPLVLTSVRAHRETTPPLYPPQTHSQPTYYTLEPDKMALQKSKNQLKGVF